MAELQFYNLSDPGARNRTKTELRYESRKIV